MKILFAVILSLACAVGAYAQTPTYAAQSVSVPNVAEGGTSNALALVIDCRKQQQLTLQFTVNSGVTNEVYRLGASVDGLSYDTNHWVIGLSGATSTTTLTNLNTLGFGYVRVDSAFNPGGSPGSLTATNTLKYGLKISAP